MIRSALCLLSLLAVMATTPGCSDDDDDGARRRFVVSVDGVTASESVSDLEDRQLAEVCGSYEAYLDAEVSFEAIAYAICLPRSIVLGRGEDGCRERLEECMDRFPEPIAFQVNASGDAPCIAGLRTCDASVAELEGCINLNFEFLFDILDTWTCRGLDDDRMDQARRAMDVISLCGEVEAQCGLGQLPQGPQ